MASTPTLVGPNGDPVVSQAKGLAAEIIDQRNRSENWLRQNYWDEWELAFKNYKCERDPARDDNNQEKLDPTQTRVGMPDTWALVRRRVARVTAQLPNLKFRADDPDIADRISRALMYQWDKGSVQRLQKKHVTQAELFGWSVRPWYWVYDERKRKRRVNPLDQNLDEKYAESIQQQYGQHIAKYTSEGMADSGQIVGRLLQEFGRGNLLAIEYLYKCYEGPRCDFLFVGDCFPEPMFESLQGSRWFIVDRKRRKDWFEKLAKLFPQLAVNIKKLFEDAPKGSPATTGNRASEGGDLRTRLLAAADRTNDQINLLSQNDDASTSPEWIVTERHVPGDNPKLAYVVNDTLIGEIPYPYDLEGKIAFTELLFIDDMLAGIGDSNARIVRGLQELHSRTANQRSDLRQNLLSPLVQTNDRKLYDNPDLLKRGKGFRIVYTASGLSVLGEQGALAAASAGDAEEAATMRMMQMATGENNMSMASGVDPQQARTATGARIMAYNGDVLSKDGIDMYTLSINADLEIMYLLNRSELTEPIKFDKNRYSRNYIGDSAQSQANQKPETMTATPEDFQYDGEVESEVGSTLADDDDAVLSKAQSIFQSATQFPQLFNTEKARNDYLIAMGKGRELSAYLPPPAPPPPPPDPRANLTVSAKMELLPLEVQSTILQQTGLMPQGQPGGESSPAGMPSDAAPMEGSPAPMPSPQDPRMPLGASAALAAVGGNPLREAMA